MGGRAGHACLYPLVQVRTQTLSSLLRRRVGLACWGLRALPYPPRGRPRKEPAVRIDLHAMESAPLESGPGPTPTKKGRAGRLPAAQEKPKERKARRPRGG
jgi:hypothetical protein